MPDFFDRLIARGAGQSTHTGEVAFAFPRVPGPFERPAAPPPDPFIETIEDVREAGPAPTPMPNPTPAPGIRSGTRSSPPPLSPDRITSRAPSVPGEPPPVRPTPARPSPLLPMATPVLLRPDAHITAPADQPADRASRAAADRDRVRVTIASRPEREPAPALPRTLAVPAAAVHPVQAADGARSVQTQPPEPPVVTVRIGRIEVRETNKDRREHPKNQAKRRPVPKLTLAAYLAAVNAGQNGGHNAGGAR